MGVVCTHLAKTSPGRRDIRSVSLTNVGQDLNDPVLLSGANALNKENKQSDSDVQKDTRTHRRADLLTVPSSTSSSGANVSVVEPQQDVEMPVLPVEKKQQQRPQQSITTRQKALVKVPPLRYQGNSSPSNIPRSLLSPNAAKKRIPIHRRGGDCSTDTSNNVVVSLPDIPGATRNSQHDNRLPNINTNCSNDGAIEPGVTILIHDEPRSNGKSGWITATESSPRHAMFAPPTPSGVSDDPAVLSLSTTYSGSFAVDGECAVGGVPRESAEQAVLELVRRTFTRRLQRQLLPYVLRALTIQTVTRTAPLPVITPGLLLGCLTDLKGERAPFATTIDLCTLRDAAPVLLKYRLVTKCEAVIAEALSASQGKVTVTNPQAARTEVVASLLRSSSRSDVCFGAFTPQGVSREMLMGSRLFFPKSLNSYSKGGICSLSSMHRINNSCSNSATGSLGRLWTTRDDIVGVASFEVMPSLFLKISHSRRLALRDGTRGHRARRGEVRPMFKREFVATLTSGCEGVCTYASTMLPEFLVDLKSFPSEPERAVVSAVRATLHRMNNTIARDMLHYKVMTLPVNRASIRAPPVDMAVVYLREESIYYASTPGMRGMIFFFTEARQRLCAELEESDSSAAQGDTPFSSLREKWDDSTLRSSFGSSKSPPQWSRKVYELPDLRHGMFDLLRLQDDISAVLSSESGCSNPPQGCRLMVAQSLFCNNSLLWEAAAVSSDISSPRVSQEQQQEEEVEEKDFREGRLPPPEELPLTKEALPHVLVVAVAEFWGEMSSVGAWELLRWMLLLDRDAGNTTMPHQECTADGAAASESKEATPYLEALLESTCITPATKQRLEQFYKDRVLHYASADARYARTPEHTMEEAMRNYRPEHGVSKSAATAEQPAAGESLGDAMAALLAATVQGRLAVPPTAADEKKAAGPSSAVMVTVVPAATAAAVTAATVREDRRGKTAGALAEVSVSPSVKVRQAS